MILNRTVGGQRKYRITVDNGKILEVVSSASAGMFVNIATVQNFVIQTNANGVIVPFLEGKAGEENISTYAPEPSPSRSYYYFVMPAEDVTIS